MPDYKEAINSQAQEYLNEGNKYAGKALRSLGRFLDSMGRLTDDLGFTLGSGGWRRPSNIEEAQRVSRPGQVSKIKAAIRSWFGK